MAGDTTLNNLLGTPAAGFAESIYYQQAPDEAQFPFVVFHKQSGIPTETFADPSAIESDVWMVKGVDRNTTADTSEAIQARLQTLLNDAPLTISGSVLLYLRRQSDVDYPETVDGVQYKHAGSLYRLVTD
jgi:hypothetical protein